MNYMICSYISDVLRHTDQQSEIMIEPGCMHFCIISNKVLAFLSGTITANTFLALVLFTPLLFVQGFVLLPINVSSISTSIPSPPIISVLCDIL